MRCASRSTNSFVATGAAFQTDRRRLLEGFQFVQIARKVVGVGSVGTRAWILLLVGKDDDDPLSPPGQRTAEASVHYFEEYVGKSGYASHGGFLSSGGRSAPRCKRRPTSSLAMERFGGAGRSQAGTSSLFASSETSWKGELQRSKARSPRALRNACPSALGLWHAPTPAQVIASPSPVTWVGRTFDSNRALAGVRRHLCPAPEWAELPGAPGGSCRAAGVRCVRAGL